MLKKCAPWREGNAWRTNSVSTSFSRIFRIFECLYVICLGSLLLKMSLMKQDKAKRLKSQLSPYSNRLLNYTTPGPDTHMCVILAIPGERPALSLLNYPPLPAWLLSHSKQFCSFYENWILIFLCCLVKTVSYVNCSLLIPSITILLINTIKYYNFFCMYFRVTSFNRNFILFTF